MTSNGNGWTSVGTSTPGGTVTEHSCGMDWCVVCHQSGGDQHICKGSKQTRVIKGKDVTFREWFERVNACVQHLSQGMVGVADLPDFPSWDSWDSQITPASAARELLESEGFPFDD